MKSEKVPFFTYVGSMLQEQLEICHQHQSTSTLCSYGQWSSLGGRRLLRCSVRQLGAQQDRSLHRSPCGVHGGSLHGADAHIGDPKLQDLSERGPEVSDLRKKRDFFGLTNVDNVKASTKSSQALDTHLSEQLLFWDYPKVGRNSSQHAR